MSHPTIYSRAALLGLGLLVACSQRESPQASAASDEIALTIVNASPEPLRCVTLLAHFITRDLPVMAPGDKVSIVLGRERHNGSLSYGYHNDKPMLLENILCGHAAAWDASRQDIPLQGLRAEPDETYSIACQGSGTALACSAPTPP